MKENTAGKKTWICGDKASERGRQLLNSRSNTDHKAFGHNEKKVHIKGQLSTCVLLLLDCQNRQRHMKAAGYAGKAKARRHRTRMMATAEMRKPDSAVDWAEKYTFTLLARRAMRPMCLILSGICCGCQEQRRWMPFWGRQIVGGNLPAGIRSVKSTLRAGKRHLMGHF